MDKPSAAATTGSAAPSGEPSPNVAASAVPATPAPTVVGLSLESVAGTGTKTDVWLVAPALELRERIAAVSPDVGCALATTEAGWAVFCADVFPNAVATLRRVDAGLSLERLGAPSRSFPLPGAATVSLGTAVGGARAVPGQACDPAAKTKPLKALVSTRSNAGDRFDGGKVAVVEGGRTLAWPLPQVPANAVCRVVDPQDGSRQLVCAKQPICSFKGSSGLLEIACGAARTVVFTRCGSVPTPEVETISRSRAYD